MAQLSNDCFALGGGLLTVAAALAEIEARITPVVGTGMGPVAGGGGGVLGRGAAGPPLRRSARRGEGVRIFTGAPMPDGTDTVIMQEDCALEDERVRLRPGIKKGANRRHAGEDIAKDETALSVGLRLRAPDLGLAAALGYREVCAVRRLRVAP